VFIKLEILKKLNHLLIFAFDMVRQPVHEKLGDVDGYGVAIANLD
jgi:hypothetical protein